MEELNKQVDAMTIVIAALHHTITQGAFQTITFSKAELDEMVGSTVALQPTDEGGVTVLLQLGPGDDGAQLQGEPPAG